jgi:hypothetical protein
VRWQAAPGPTKPGEPATPDQDQVFGVGVVDLELVERGKLFVVRDEAYEIALPLKPRVEGGDQVAPSGVKQHTAMALAARDHEVYGFSAWR